MKISVEAWHIYGLKLPIKWSHTECMAIQDFSGTDFWYELETSSKVSDLLEAEWHKIETIWFNDNILPNITTDAPRMWRFYSRMLTRVSEIFTSLWKPDFTQKYENNLIPRAKSESIPEIIAAIESDEEWCYEHQKNWIKWPRINKKQQKIRLKWYASHPDIPSCEVLDFTLYKEKLEESDATITIFYLVSFFSKKYVHFWKFVIVLVIFSSFVSWIVFSCVLKTVVLYLLYVCSWVR